MIVLMLLSEQMLIGHGKLGKVMESHGILKSSKSTNPEVCKCGQLIGFEFTSCCFEQIHANVVCLATYARIKPIIFF